MKQQPTQKTDSVLETEPVVLLAGKTGRKSPSTAGLKGG